MEKFEISWDAPEFEYREKDVSWYWLSIIAAAIIVAFAVWQKNFLFGLFVVIAEILLIIWGNRLPRTVSFSMTESGLTIGAEKKYAFKEFEKMSVNEDTIEGWVELIFVLRERFKAPLIILFPEDRLPDLRLHSKTILKEVPHDPSLIDSIEKLSRF